MPMLELVLSVCQITNPSHCQDVKLNFAEENITPMQCMMSGQAEIAKWVNFHPDWKVSKWSCARAGLLAKA